MPVSLASFSKATTSSLRRASRSTELEIGIVTASRGIPVRYGAESASTVSSSALFSPITCTLIMLLSRRINCDTLAIIPICPRKVSGSGSSVVEGFMIFFISSVKISENDSDFFSSSGTMIIKNLPSASIAASTALTDALFSRSNCMDIPGKRTRSRTVTTGISFTDTLTAESSVVPFFLLAISFT